MTIPSRSWIAENDSGTASATQAGLRRPLAVVPPGDLLDRRDVLRSRRLDGEGLGPGREERFADDRVLDLVQHVRGIAPEARRHWHRGPLPATAATLPDGSAGTALVGRPDEPGDRRLHRVVQAQSVLASLDERKGA